MPPMLLAILFLGSDSAQSLSTIDNYGYRSDHRHSSLVKLRAGNNNEGGKIDWKPESNPKIAQLPSYSDNWLLNFHNWDQSEKQLVTNSLAKWNEEIRNEQATIIEWQDSFQRNDLADFTPPMSNGLNCLMVGEDFGVVNDDDDGNGRVKLPWEEESGAQITTLRVLEESVVDDTPEKGGLVIESTKVSEIPTETAITTSGQSIAGTNGGRIQTELVPYVSTTTTTPSGSSSAIVAQDPNKQAASYDCIVDQGLLDRILPLENSHETVHELLEEAAIAIKDLGIYVLVTKELTEESRKILDDYGLKAGLEWQFELDGISDDTQVVSVARRFCTGEMPKVGRLSRYQPNRTQIKSQH